MKENKTIKALLSLIKEQDKEIEYQKLLLELNKPYLKYTNITLYETM